MLAVHTGLPPTNAPVAVGPVTAPPSALASARTQQMGSPPAYVPVTAGPTLPSSQVGLPPAYIPVPAGPTLAGAGMGVSPGTFETYFFAPDNYP